MKKKVFAVIMFLVIAISVLGVVQEILKAKYVQDSTAIVDGFYAEKKNDIEVLFLGSSNCFCTIDPLVLYKEYGIAAYDFASSSQSMDISLLYLKEALKRQKPKVVALEVNYIPGQNATTLGENSILWGLTDMPFSVNKLNCLYHLLGKIDENYISYAFPLLRYHERWKEISKQDYVYMLDDKTNWNKGYMRTNQVSDNPVDLSAYAQEGSAWLDERAIECLNEMADICKKEGITLLLFKSPKADWYQYFSTEIEAIAIEKGLTFLDYNSLVKDVGLNVDTDFRDSYHLNEKGAAKVSRHLGAYLQANFELADRRLDEVDNSWDIALAYQERIRLSESDFSELKTVTECKEMLDNKDDYATIITYKGAKDKVQYQWIYVEGKPVYTKVWEEDGIAHKKIENLDVVFVRERKVLNIFIEGESCYEPHKNWYVIIYDMKTDAIVAQLSFDE